MSDLTLCQQIQVNQLMANHTPTVKDKVELLNAYGYDICSLESIQLLSKMEYAVIAAQVIANTPKY